MDESSKIGFFRLHKAKKGENCRWWLKTAFTGNRRDRIHADCFKHGIFALCLPRAFAIGESNEGVAEKFMTFRFQFMSHLLDKRDIDTILDLKFSSDHLISFVIYRSENSKKRVIFRLQINIHIHSTFFVLLGFRRKEKARLLSICSTKKINITVQRQ